MELSSHVIYTRIIIVFINIYVLMLLLYIFANCINVSYHASCFLPRVTVAGIFAMAHYFTPNIIPLIG